MQRSSRGWLRLTGQPGACLWGAGQERKEVPFASHTACTIEMTNLQRRVDVAVIDEIQVGRGPHAHPMWAASLQHPAYEQTGARWT